MYIQFTHIAQKFAKNVYQAASEPVLAPHATCSHELLHKLFVDVYYYII